MENYDQANVIIWLLIGSQSLELTLNSPLWSLAASEDYNTSVTIFSGSWVVQSLHTPYYKWSLEHWFYIQ